MEGQRCGAEAPEELPPGWKTREERWRLMMSCLLAGRPERKAGGL